MPDHRATRWDAYGRPLDGTEDIRDADTGQPIRRPPLTLDEIEAELDFLSERVPVEAAWHIHTALVAVRGAIRDLERATVAQMNAAEDAA